MASIAAAVHVAVPIIGSEIVIAVLPIEISVVGVAPTAKFITPVAA